MNLFLHVVGRRADGYHLLQSVFVLIDWADTLHFERRDDATAAAPRSGDALARRRPVPARGARVAAGQRHARWAPTSTSTSGVPAGAGLGGGSSDAATTLLALNRLWDLHWPLDRLSALALTLGADVPFFVHGRNAFVEGVGEQHHAGRAAARCGWPWSSRARRWPRRQIFASPLRSSARPRLLYSPTFLQTPS